ncbi:swi5-dependent recombination DNA repair protein 1 homolog [Anolis carolinensis]|uniref:Swi5-dependent recombination DNA repair protein 1 homolog n=1 Tax=Anolis carolinensis TaxID=28377 RepID=A0A803U1H2_ANOCA|nr:PREDICTED: swi5-dependent recombination DNA repair protein 1 homolog [Anolis carolinensis]|eukprot:XP_003218562.1 PREDICTED: swi5-dependent recombination DNA repair protein 1 homolog [Anolis carolinensis]
METTVLNEPVSLCSTPETSDQKSCSSSEKQPMSSTLRERLKKARRSFHSTLIVPKRLKIDEENNCSSTCKEESLPKGESYCISQSKDEDLEKVPDETSHLKSTIQERDLCMSECTGYSKNAQGSTEVLLLGKDDRLWELMEEKATLVKQVQEKEELLRRLKLVKMYRSKNNPTELQSLISKWRSSSQMMLYELQMALATDNQKLSITQLIDNFGLDDQLLHYNRTEEDFTDAE